MSAPLLTLALLALPTVQGPQCEASWESLDEHATPQWFRDAKFGIFIHWGVYSVPAICDTSTYSEWYQHWLDTNSHGGLVKKFHDKWYGEDFAYREFAEQFRCELWDPAEWARIFKRAGADYIVITSKHHDGFCMFDGELTDYKITNTPFRRDPTAELTEAFARNGLKLGFYYFLLDWHHPDYRPTGRPM